MKISNEWKDYELIDTSLGYKYERWGNIYLLRPDPVILWDKGDLALKYKDKIAVALPGSATRAIR